MNKIITIGREFGSGGRELGRRLSEALGIAYYDKEIISEISRHTALSEQYIQTIVKRTPIRPFPIHIGRSFYAPVNPPFQQHLNIHVYQPLPVNHLNAVSYFCLWCF